MGKQTKYAKLRKGELNLETIERDKKAIYSPEITK